MEDRHLLRLGANKQLLDCMSYAGRMFEKYAGYFASALTNDDLRAMEDMAIEVAKAIEDFRRTR
jgi:hypothetical protein